MLKLQQLRAAMTDEQKKAELERRNHPMRQAFNIMAQVNRNLHDTLPGALADDNDNTASNRAPRA
ncbi:MAG: hypothetical protein HYX61_03370 [Gammaproteobacteria bacterium]|jgi:hypothetical protein|nr:hypothetical protein [Gammaproteobacteria bacterium]